MTDEYDLKDSKPGKPAVGQPNTPTPQDPARQQNERANSAQSATPQKLIDRPAAQLDQAQKALNAGAKPQGSLEDFLESWGAEHLASKDLRPLAEQHPLAFARERLKLLAAALREAGHAR